MNVEIYERMYLSERDNWWFKGRRELVTEMVARASNSSEGSGDAALKILDVGCGTGLNTKDFEHFGEVYGLDASEAALRFCSLRGSTRLLRGSADKLPIKDESFDLLCALDLLEHVEDDIGAIKEFHRILKPGGYLILTVPAFMFLWSGHDVALHHKRRYNKRILVNNLKLGGFFVTMNTHWNVILFPGVALLRVINKRKGNRVGEEDLLEMNQLINNVLLQVLRIENLVIKHGVNLPFGVSILCICKKRSIEN